MHIFCVFSSLIAAVLVGTAAVMATPKLQVQLSGPSAVNGANNFKVLAAITNTGDETLTLLNDPRGPLSKIPAETFSIVHESGDVPEFVGVKAKYVPSNAVKLGRENAFTVLTPGESISIEHHLSIAYDFGSTGPGRYVINVTNQYLFVDPQTGAPRQLVANQPVVHVVTLSGQMSILESVATKRETYTSCSAEQERILVQAALAAQSYAATALSYTQTHDMSTDRFTTWFGAYTSVDHDFILTHFTNLNGNNYSAYSFDCSCTDSGVYAYSRPTIYGKVWLCGTFWLAPLTGTDSQGGTLIHESTHFVVNAGTQDYAYGQTDAMALAKSNASEATMNADSHEFVLTYTHGPRPYYAENNPVLP